KSSTWARAKILRYATSRSSSRMRLAMPVNSNSTPTSPTVHPENCWMCRGSITWDGKHASDWKKESGLSHANTRSSGSFPLWRPVNALISLGTHVFLREGRLHHRLQLVHS